MLILATLAGKRLVLSSNAGSLTGHDPGTGRCCCMSPGGPRTTGRKRRSRWCWGRATGFFSSAGYGMGCGVLQVKAGADGRLTAEELWRAKTMKTQFNSAAARDGFLYGLDDGLLACVEAATGKRRWKDGRYGAGQTLIVDDLVLSRANRGRWCWPRRTRIRTRNWAGGRGAEPARRGIFRRWRAAICWCGTTSRRRVMSCR